MDEKLAKGYASQFISWFDDDLKKAHKLFKSAINESKKLFQSEKSFEKFCLKVKLIYKNFYFNYTHVSTKKNPYFAFVVFGPIQAQYKNWTERNLEGIVGYFSFDGKNIGLRPSVFLIGEHALARTFQRSNIVNEKLAKNHYEILSEFKYVAIWVTFWELFKIFLQKNLLNFSPLLPAPNGLFYCEYELLSEAQTPQVYRIHLRTYVGKDELSEDQENLRKLMIDASKNLEDSALAFFPHLIGSIERQYLQDFDLLRNRVKNFLPQIAKEVFKFQDDVEMSIFLNNAITALKKDLPPNIGHLDSELNKLGYKEFINQLVLQKKSSNKKLIN